MRAKLGARPTVSFFPSVDYTDLNSLPTATGAMGRVDAGRDEFSTADVGDGFALAELTDNTIRLLTSNLHRKYDQRILAKLRQYAWAAGVPPRMMSHDPRIRKAIRDMFQSTRNRPDGTGEGMMNGDPNMDKYVHSTTLPLSRVRAVLFGSDGLVPPGMDERKPHDQQRLMGIARHAGLGGVMKLVQLTQDADPDRWLVRYKHADDASGIYMQFS